MRLGMGLGLGNLLSGQPLTGFPNDFSFNFDGSNDYLDSGNSTGIQFSGSFSVSFWFNTTDATATNEIFVSKCNDGVNDGWLIKLNSSRKLEFGLNSSLITDSGSASNDGNWHHVVAVHESGVGNRLYKNGSLVASNSTGTDLSNHVPNLHIGNQDYSTPRAINSLIDEVALWNTALSADDVAKIASKPVDFSKASTYATDRASNLKLWLRAGDKVLPESDASIARSDFYTDFDGTDDVVLIEDNSSFDFGTNDYTMMAWAKTSSSTYQAIVGQGQTGTNPLKLIYIDNNGYFKGAIEDSSANSVDSSGDGGIWDDGNWHHFVIVFKYGDKMYRYVDGKNVGTNDSISSVGSTDSSVKFSIGAFFGGVTYSTLLFNGQISNISVYQTALDSQTIKQFAKSRYTPMRDNRFSVVDFDGTNDKITMTASSAVSPTEAITVSTWVNFNAIQNYDVVVANSDDGNNGWRIAIDNSGNIMFSVNFWAGNIAKTSITTGVWHHIVGTYDKTNVKLYVNGELKDTDSYTGSISYSSNAFQIGFLDTWSYLDGSVSSASVYSTAKSADEVYAIYQQGITYDESSLSGLVGYWRMGDDTSKAYPTIADSSSNSNDGTMTSMASDDIVQQMVAGYDMGAFESSSEELGGSEITSASNTTFSGVTSNDWSVPADVTKSFSNDQMVFTMDDDTPAGYVAQFSAGNFAGGSGIPQKFLKITLDIDSTTTGSYSINNAGGGCSADVFLKNPLTTGVNTIYGVCNGGSSYFRIFEVDVSTGDKLVLNSFDVQEVLQSDLSDTYPAIIDVNEPVLGAELITSNTTSEWAQYGSGGSEANTANGVALTAGSDTRNAYRTVSGLTDGKLYKLNVDAYYSGSSDTVKIEIIAGSGSLFTPALTTTSTNYIIYFVKNSGTMYILGNGFNNGNVLYVENLTVKEIQGNVGTMTNQDSADLVYSSVLPDQSFLTGVNSAYNFIDLDGSDEFISSSSNIGISGSNAYTMNCWFKLDAYGSYPVLMSSGEEVAYKENSFLIRTDNNTIGWGNQVGANDIPNASGTTISLNTWYMATITFNGSDTIKIYANGTLDVSKSVSSINITNSVLYIGKRASGLFLNGQITQCSVFNKELSSTEVSAIYNLGRHGNLLDSYSDNLLGYWAMSALDASTGLPDVGNGTIYDRSGNSNHGTGTNTEASDLASSPNAEPNGYAKGDTNRSTTIP